MGHCRTDSNDRGSIVFLCNNVNDATSVTMSDERMRITSTGNVGIGTNNPLISLDVNGSLLVRASKTGAGGTQGILFRDGGYQATALYNCSILTYDHAAANFSDGLSINGYSGISFCTGSDSRQERMRITSTGNVGIGTNNPTNILQVGAGTGNGGRLRISNGVSDYTQIGTIDTDSASTNTRILVFGHTSGAAGQIIYVTTSTGPHVFYNGIDERMRITSTGNVGIGTNNPVGKLHINGAILSMPSTATTATWDHIRLSHDEELARIDAGGSSAIVFGIDNTTTVYPNATYVERMRITSTGNVGIGTNAPECKLDIRDNYLKIGYLTSGTFDNVSRLQVYGSDGNSIVASFKHPNNTQGIGIGWDGIIALGNGSSSIGTGNQGIRLTTLGTGVVYVSGNLTATGTKSWVIKHPILENKDLMHVCIEAPRADNLYRGRKQLMNGECEVNLDLECNTTGGMTEGCFVLINKNIQVFVNNNETFDKVVGKVVGNKIIVECDNANASCFIDWLVIGERNDNEIINNLNTSSSGSVIVEIDRVAQQMQDNMSGSNTSNVY